MKIILASQSPRRKQLLQQAEIQFDVIAVDVEETIDYSLPIQEVPINIALQKVNAVKNSFNEFDVLIGADTIVVLNNEIIGKPSSRQEAITTLEKLSAQTHQVITGVVVLKNENGILHEHHFSDTTFVEFNTITTKQIEFYVDKYKPYDKAGAYAIQEWIGVIGIKAIRGCFYNVMGLPVSKLLPYLNN